MIVLISLYQQAAIAWALGQIGRHTPEHAKAVAVTNVLQSLLYCFLNTASSEDLQAKVTNGPQLLHVFHFFLCNINQKRHAKKTTETVKSAISGL